MASLDIINQPLNGQLGEYLIDAVDSSSFNELNIVVAFAKNSGVLRLKNALESFRANGSHVNTYVGIDLDGTSYEALTTLYAVSDSLFVVHAESEQTFHSKIYNLVGPEKAIVMIGSNNLTAGGLWTNLESCSIAKLDLNNPSDLEIQSQVRSYIEDLTAIKGLSLEIKCQDAIDQLLDQGYIAKEARSRIRNVSVRKKASYEHDGLWSFIQRVSADLPRIKNSSPADQSRTLTPDIEDDDSTLPVRLNDEGRIIWFETRRMTGGSRNILDLSKTALIDQGTARNTAFALEDEHFMKGGVQFFGIDPTDEDQSKDITINFNGIDYHGNTIKYPIGDRANGTWRLQIKGASDIGVPITQAFERDYLVDKILTFTKVQDDYFFMSVFDSADLNDFIEVSKVVAFNGRNRGSKLLGIM